MRDRRAIVFLVFAGLCFALTPIAQQAHRWLTVGTGIVYVLLAIASALDARTRARR